MIAPTLAGSINLSFDNFNTQVSNDIVTVYDGSNTSAPVIGTYSGNSIPPSVISSGSTMYVTFTTNGSVTQSGWLANYTTNLPEYCVSQTNLTASTDTFSDGSGSNDYNNGTLCRWQIAPPNATSITLNFINFNVEADNDKVRIIDFASSTLLATYSGNSIPSSITSNSGELLVQFITNSSVVASGWTAYYTSTPMGIEEFGVVNDVSIYPNPSNDKLNISFSVLNEKEVLIKIFDIAGREIFDQSLISNSGIFNKVIDISELKKGLYTLRLITQSEIINKKILLK